MNSKLIKVLSFGGLALAAIATAMSDKAKEAEMKNYVDKRLEEKAKESK